MKKKFKKVTIALIVLLMVIAGTLAWLVTSDFKKGKIGAADFALDVEAVRLATDDDEDPDSDGFVQNDAEALLRSDTATEDEKATTFHYVDTDLYPISKSNLTAIYDEDKVATKYIRITNNNDADAIVEISANSVNADELLMTTVAAPAAENGDGGELLDKLEVAAAEATAAPVVAATSKAAGVSWLIGAPRGYMTYMSDTVAVAAVQQPALANILNNKAADIVTAWNKDEEDLIDKDAVLNSNAYIMYDSNDEPYDNDFFRLLNIGYSADVRNRAWEVDDSGDTTTAYPLIDYDAYEDGDDVTSLLQRNVVYVMDGSPIAGITSNVKLPLLNEAKTGSLANILKSQEEPEEEEQVEKTEDPVVTPVEEEKEEEKQEAPAAPAIEKAEFIYTADDISGQYVHQTFEDADTTGFALPFVLRAHTSVVIPFKVFLNEDWTEKNGNFEYDINVKARNYTDGDDITFQAEKKEAEEDDVAALATKLTALAETLAKNNIWDLKLSGDAKVFSDFDSSADFNKYILAAVDKGDLTATEIKNMISAVIDEYAYEVHKANQNGLNGENYTGEYSSLLLSALTNGIDNTATLTNVVYGKRDYSQYTETQLRQLMRNILNYLDAKADKLVSSEYMNSQFLSIYNFKTGEFSDADKMVGAKFNGEFALGELKKDS